MSMTVLILHRCRHRETRRRVVYVRHQFEDDAHDGHPRPNARYLGHLLTHENELAVNLAIMRQTAGAEWTRNESAGLASGSKTMRRSRTSPTSSSSSGMSDSHLLWLSSNSALVTCLSLRPTTVSYLWLLLSSRLTVYVL